jgi:hypothetical protein
MRPSDSKKVGLSALDKLLSLLNKCVNYSNTIAYIDSKRCQMNTASQFMLIDKDMVRNKSGKASILLLSVGMPIQTF